MASLIAIESLWKSLWKKILRVITNPVKLREILEPIMDFQWNRKLIIAVGTPAINDLMRRIKRSETPPELFNKVRRKFAEYFFEESLTRPARMGRVAPPHYAI